MKVKKEVYSFTQVLWFCGVGENSRGTNFQQSCCIYEIAPVHTSPKRIYQKNLFHGAEDYNRKQNQFAQRHCVRAFKLQIKL